MRSENVSGRYRFILQITMQQHNTLYFFLGILNEIKTYTKAIRLFALDYYCVNVDDGENRNLELII